MKKNMLSLVLGTALALPTIAMAAPNAVNNADLMPADMRSMPVDNTLQAEIEGPDGELLATQPGAVDIDEDNMDMDDEDDMAVAEDNVAIAEAEPTMPNSTTSYQPMLAGENANSNVTPADMREQPVESTLQEKKKDRRGELLATQPGQVEFNESRRFTIR